MYKFKLGKFEQNIKIVDDGLVYSLKDLELCKN